VSLPTDAGASAVATTTSVVRVINERAVYERVRELGSASASQLVASTGLSKPTVTLAVTNLVRAGLLEQVGLRTGQAGRAARLYQLRPEAGFVVAVDIGRSWVRLALADLSGTLRRRHEVRSRARTASSLVAQVGDLAHALAAESGLSYADITHTVVGSPGVYDESTGTLRLAPNLPGWEKPGVVHALHESVGPRLSIENDVNLATRGEMEQGLGRGVRNFVFVSVGTGLGMGLVVEGRLYRGFQGAAGEISYLPFNGESGEPGTSPGRRATRGRGPLERETSPEAILARARAAGITAARSSEEVFDAARAGEARAVSVVDRQADYLARALAAVVAVVDPELVVLGGGIGRNGDLLVEPLRRHLTGWVPLAAPHIRASALGTDAVLVGGLAEGLAMAREHVFSAASQP
jgi:predicted NBD/HSP70 family sugar kinase